MKKIFIICLTMAVLLAMGLVGYSLVNDTVAIGDSIKYNAEVCVYKNNELVQCSHNTLTDAGKNAIRDYLGQGGAAAFDYIALANNTKSTDYAVTNTSMSGEQTCCGLARAQGAYVAVGGANGNWTISKVFTCETEAVSEVNHTALFNASSTGTILAYNGFVPVDLQVDDQLNITWTLWVT